MTQHFLDEESLSATDSIGGYDGIRDEVARILSSGAVDKVFGLHTQLTNLLSNDATDGGAALLALLTSLPNDDAAADSPDGDTALRAQLARLLDKVTAHYEGFFIANNPNTQGISQEVIGASGNTRQLTQTYPQWPAALVALDNLSANKRRPKPL